MFVNRLGELYAFLLRLPLPCHRGQPLYAFEPDDEVDAHNDEIHRRHPGGQRPLVARAEVQTGAHPQADGGVRGDGRRGPGHVQPKGREDHGNRAKSRVVGEKDVVVESAADIDVGCNQRNVHGAEANHPAPGHRPVRQEPVVEYTIERCQHHIQEGVSNVLGIPETRTVGQQNGGEEPDDPSPPDRDLRGVERHVGVGQGEPLPHPPYGVYVRHQDFRQLTLRLNLRRDTLRRPVSRSRAAIPVGADAQVAIIGLHESSSRIYRLICSDSRPECVHLGWTYR